MSSSPAPKNLRCEYLTNPTSIESQPRLSWQLTDDRRGARQTAWQVQVASSPEALGDHADLWDSGKVESAETHHVLFGGDGLSTLKRCFWRVRSWDADGRPSAWSETATWTMGLLEPEDWQPAQWIAQRTEAGDDSQPAQYLRTTFRLDQPVTQAWLAITARGLYEAHLNGRRLGNARFTPGWTDYNVRIPYQIYEVGELLAEGTNALGAVLGDGWFCGYLCWQDNRCQYGPAPSLLAKLIIELADGSRVQISSNEQWQGSTGPILESDIYNGETYDARLEMDGWTTAGFNADGWQPVIPVDPPEAKLSAKHATDVVPIRELEPVELNEPEPGVYVYNMGQNMVGHVRLRVSGPAGTTITIRHAEMLEDDGTLYTANLRDAEATDRYTLKGDGEELYEPHFTFHGFQYVELTGCPEPPTLDSIRGVVIHNDMATTGSFECSHELVNRLQSNIQWGQRGNFLEVPTDCPQRNERLGWTGDAQVFVRTACWNLDVAAFFTKWCRDLCDSQLPDGSVPDVVPNVTGGAGRCAWADAMVIVPWTIYLCYGDERVLSTTYDAMARWVDFMASTSTDLIRPNEGYGDWLAIDAPSPGAAPTPKDLIGTAYFAHDTALLSRIAAIIGRDADAERYGELAAKVRNAFNREFVSPGGRVVGHTQTGYLLALGFDLLPGHLRPAALEHLVKDIERRNYHLSTGFVGTPLLAPVLSRFGRSDVAYKLLLQETYPGWLYPVINGATTMWERWNSYTPEQGFGEVSMNSFNHYAYGAIGEWLYNTVAGIDLDPTQPGYRHIRISPRPGEALEWARGELLSLHGPIRSAWAEKPDGYLYTFTIPANTTASVTLPAEDGAEAILDGAPVAEAEGITEVRHEAGSLRFTAVAGTYEVMVRAAGGE